MEAHMETYSFFLETVQINNMKKLFEILKEITAEMKLKITERGITITTMNIPKTLLVYLTLDADKFDKYYCEKPLEVGVNVLFLSKIMRNIVQDDTLIIGVSKSDESMLSFETYNSKSHTKKTYKIKILEIDDQQNYILPTIQSKCILTMATSEFQKTCREALNLDNVIEIKISTHESNQLIFSNEGNMGSFEQIATDSNDLQFDICSEEKNIFYQGYFELKNLMLFTKCESLAQYMNILIVKIENFDQEPLVLEFAVGSLGKIIAIIAKKDITENEF